MDFHVKIVKDKRGKSERVVFFNARERKSERSERKARGDGMRGELLRHFAAVSLQ